MRETRVAEAVVAENLRNGMSLDDILAEYPTLDRADVETWLAAQHRHVWASD